MPSTSTFSPSAHAARGSWWDRRAFSAVGVVLLAALLLAAYRNSFEVPFLLDDQDAIGNNPTLRDWSTAFFPPTDSATTVSGRPLLNLSLALNYRLGGTALRGYHLVNLLIHFAAALCLWGAAARTLRLPVVAPRFAAHATPLGWLIATVWAVHPLQTESVTYIVQRAESLVGLCYLFTLYAFIRALASSARAWSIVTVVACLLGMMAKEVMATAPLALLLYDRTFVSGTFREAWRRRRACYGALAATWLVLLALVVASGARGASVGFTEFSWLDYAFTQAAGIAGYLQRALVPANLVFDYGPVLETRRWALAAGVVVVGGMLAATLRLLRSHPLAGFFGAWFFLILAPTSSVIPIASQTLAEHRMYLPLAAVIAVGVLVAYRAFGQFVWSLGAGVIIAASLITLNRNDVYRSELVLWQDTVSKAGKNPRAWNNLGLAYSNGGRLTDAARCFEKATEFGPTYAIAFANLGLTLSKQATAVTDSSIANNRLERAIAALGKAVELSPDKPNFLSSYGTALLDAGEFEPALAPLGRAVALAPDDATNHFNYANALVRLDRNAEAARHYEAAVRLEPDGVDVRTNYGLLLQRMGRTADAIEQLRAAAVLAPTLPRVRCNLGAALIAAGEHGAGRRELEESLRLDANYVDAHFHLANAFAAMGEDAAAIRHLEAVAALSSPSAEVFGNLGLLYARSGQAETAVARFRRALELDPSYVLAREQLNRLAPR